MHYIFATAAVLLAAATASLAAVEISTDQLGRDTARGATVVIDGVEAISPVKIVFETGRAVTVGAKDRPALWLMLCATGKDLEEIGAAIDAGKPPITPAPGCTLGWAVFNDKGRMGRLSLPWSSLVGLERSRQEARVAYARKVASETTATAVTMNGPATAAAPGQPASVSSRVARTTTATTVSGCTVVGFAFVEGGPFLALVEVESSAPRPPAGAATRANPANRAEADRAFGDLNKLIDQEMAKTATQPAAK